METFLAPKLKKVAIIGPESTGKSELAVFLAKAFQTCYVPEFAREYLEKLPRPYVQADLLPIAQGQLQLERTLMPKAKEVLICDTNLYVIQIWSEFKYGSCDPEILRLAQSSRYDLHLLTDIDLPWEPDPLREHPHHRKELFTIYEKLLHTLQLPYIRISGEREQRQKKAYESVNRLIHP